MRTPSKRAAAIRGLRDAYLRLEFIRCLNELEDDQEWIDDMLRIAARKMARMLRVLEPKRRLPNVRDDMSLGRSITAAEKEQRKYAKCEHDLRPYKEHEKLMHLVGMTCERCRRCGMTRWVPLKDHRTRKKQLQS
jgi:hypothetical protein